MDGRRSVESARQPGAGAGRRLPDQRCPGRYVRQSCRHDRRRRRDDRAADRADPIEPARVEASVARWQADVRPNPASVLTGPGGRGAALSIRPRSARTGRIDSGRVHGRPRSEREPAGMASRKGRDPARRRRHLRPGMGPRRGQPDDQPGDQERGRGHQVRAGGADRRGPDGGIAATTTVGALDDSSQARRRMRRAMAGRDNRLTRRRRSSPDSLASELPEVRLVPRFRTAAGSRCQRTRSRPLDEGGSAARTSGEPALAQPTRCLDERPAIGPPFPGLLGQRPRDDRPLGPRQHREVGIAEEVAHHDRRPAGPTNGSRPPRSWQYVTASEYWSDVAETWRRKVSGAA